MNTRLCVVLLVVALAKIALNQLVASEEPTGASEEPSVANDRLTTCPDGHKELHEVPIRYGLVSNDAQLKQDLEDLKYVLGGCCVGKDSPKTTIICGKCRFRYQGGGVWHKSNTNIKLFGKEFAPVLLEFLALLKPEDTVHCDQTVKNSQLISQRVQFKCSRDRENLDTEVPRLMQQHGIHRDPSRYQHEVFYGSDSQANVVRVWVLTDRGNQLLDLSISTKNRK